MKSRAMVFLGSKAAGLQALRALAVGLPAGSLKAIVCPDDRQDQRSVHDDFVALARGLGVPFHCAAVGEDLVSLLQEYRPETVIVHGWYRIIRVAQFPHTEFLGFHYSPLPKYRGNAPLVWQIINGERRLAVSFFVLTEAMDEGDLLDQRYFDLSESEDIADALARANTLTENMIVDFVPRWLSGTVARVEQDSLVPSYGGLRLPEDGRIDWKASATVVHNFIRAQAHPYPGAWTMLPDGRRMNVWKSACEERLFFGSAGGVVEAGAHGVVIACGAGAIRVLSVQVDGEPERDARDVLKSLRTRLI